MDTSESKVECLRSKSQKKEQFSVKLEEIFNDSERLHKSNETIGSEEIDSLFGARDKLRLFVQEINDIKYTSIRKDALQHCDKIKIGSVGQLGFDTVERMAKNRIEKMIKNKRIKKNWSQEDVKILLWIVSKYCDLKDIDDIQKQLDLSDWNQIASLIPGVKGDQCMFKWLSLKKNNLSENSWSEKESSLLDKIVKKFGDKDWQLISQKLYYLNSSSQKIYRCPKQCREHWNCYLNPKLKKGPWSKNEDLVLLNCIKKNNGLKRWAEMISLFSGRTQNALKNRFTLIIEKQMKMRNSDRQLSQLELIDQYLERSYVQQFVTTQNEQKISFEKKPAKQKCQDVKKEVRFFLRKRDHLSLPEQSQKTNKIQQKEDKDILKDAQISFAEESFNLPFQYTPLHSANIQPNHLSIQQNLIFEEDSYPNVPSNIKTEEQMPDVQNIKIVKLNQSNLNDLKSSLLQKNTQFVPCVISENRISKVSY